MSSSGGGPRAAHSTPPQKKKATLDKRQIFKAKEIEDMIRREDLAGRFSNIKLTTNKKKGGGKVYRIDEHKDDGSILTHYTKEDIELVAGQKIGERYRLAYSAPIMANDEMLADVGITGNGPTCYRFFKAHTTSLLAPMVTLNCWLLRR
jgi:hypothetical protein